MPTNALMKKQSLLFSLEKSFDLPVYAKQMASMIVNFGSSKPKCKKYTYVLNALEFMDKSTSKNTKTFESSMTKDSTTLSPLQLRLMRLTYLVSSNIMC